MLLTVEFNDELSLETDKVDIVTTDRMLASEFYASKFAIPEPFPNQSFRRSKRSTELAG